MARPTTRKRGGGGAERVPAWDAAAARAAADAYVPPSALEGDPDPAPPWVPYAQRDIDHQRHSYEGLMDHVADVIENKVRRVKPSRLPELVKPDGVMPLSCAVQWIAQHGGMLVINPLDEAIWREAFKDLRDCIVSGDVKVVGERPDGVSEKISGALFASCSVDYPFSDRRRLYFNDRVLGNEFCLVLHPYLDDEYWRRDHDDRLENRHGVRWRRLQALNVARCWPFGKSQDHRTGEPGRPSGMHFVEEEHRRRFQRGVAQTHVASEARELAEWFGRKHRDGPSLTARTIENRIRSAHRRLVAERSKPPRN